MRRRWLIAAFLASTALTPKPAEAGPVIGFALGALGVAGGTALAASAAYAAGAAFAATTVGGFVVKTVVGIGLSAISAALNRPSIPPPSEAMVNYAQAKSYAEWPYGLTRKGGPIGFTGFMNGRRYYVPILAACEIDGIVEHWLDERTATLTAETDAGLSNIATAPMAGYGRIDPFLGGAGQVADAGLVAAFAEITSAHDFAGLAGAVIWAKRAPGSQFTQIYPNSREWSWAPVIRGRKAIYDPRGGGSTGYTNNGALVTADWIVNILGRTVDWAEVADEADICDQLVTNKEGGTQPRWTINGTINFGQVFEEQRAQMVAACDTFIYERTDGKVGFVVGRYMAPTITLGPADFYEPRLTQGQWGADAPDEVSVIYTEPENNWRETPSGTWVAQVKALPKRDEPKVYLVNSHNQAARVAKRIARGRRAPSTLSGTIGMIGYEILGGRDGGRAHRFVRVEHPELGVSGDYEVRKITRESAAIFTVELTLVTAEDFAFDAATEEPARPVYGAVSDDGTVPDPTGLSAGAQENGAILFTWDDQDPAYTQELRYREVGTAYWLTAATATSTDRLLVGGFGNAVEVEWELRNRAGSTGVSGWVAAAATVDTVINPTAPAALTAFAVAEVSESVEVSFTAPNDQNYFGTRIYRGTTSVFASATLIHTEYGIPSDGDAYTDPTPGYATFYYWGEPINQSGMPGTLSGPQSITITAPGP